MTIETTTPPAPAPESHAPPIELPLEFRGHAGEFFRIWIVNTLLSIVTLGIYSAWAKVRTRRYFLGNTVLAGSSFDFHAEPLKILYGRLIMGVLFLVYLFGAKISLALPLAAAGIFALLFPWIIVRGMAFNLGNTSYRNLRFGFKHDYAGSYKNYALSLLILICTLGIAAPYVIFRHHRFRVSRSRFGTEFFRYEGEAKEFWHIYLLAIGVSLIYGVAVAVLMFLLTLVNKFLAIGAIPLVYGTFFLSTAWVRAHTYNEVAAETKLGALRFHANLKAGELAWLYVGNLVACLFTVGLLIPWAITRVVRYKITRTRVLGTEEALAEFVAAESTREHAIADAAVDFWDIDLGF